tara:strand:+ start:75 stop:362 length:288 start_codon:yes stop_codon:yes gene_type:complete
MEVEKLLESRGGTYGKYTSVSQISQDLKKVMRESPNYKVMPAPFQESLDMIANKISRILNGNYYYDDSWRDISGYATLALMELEDMEKHLEPDAY